MSNAKLPAPTCLFCNLDLDEHILRDGLNICQTQPADQYAQRRVFTPKSAGAEATGKSPEVEEMMPVNPQCPLYGRFMEVPMGLLNEEWAQKNHDQSLATLKRRGGLSVFEILAIVRQDRFQIMDKEVAATILYHTIKGYKIGRNSNKKA